MEDKISVIMSVYNEPEEYLKEAIESILKQTYSNFEFIIIIDKPEDIWRIDFIKGFKDERIKLIVNEKNIGLPKSLNVGIKNATGKYIARMDADDISMPERFEKQIDFIKKTNYDLCGTSIQCFFNGKDQKKLIYPSKAENVRELLKVRNCIAHPAWLGKSEVFAKLEGYRDVFSCEDYDFLIRAVEEGFSIGNIKEILLRYRLSEKSISRANPGKQELIAQFLRENFKKNRKLSLEEINEYINSDKFSKNLKGYNKYSNMKNIRGRYKSNKFPVYYIYTFLLMLDIKHSIKEIYIKLYTRYILKRDKGE